MWKKSAANHPGKELPYGNKTFQKEASLAALIHNVLQISYFCLWFFQEPGNLVHAMINLCVFACSYFLCFTCFVFCIFVFWHCRINNKGCSRRREDKLVHDPINLCETIGGPFCHSQQEEKTFVLECWFILSLATQNVTLENTQCTLIYLTWSDSRDR